MAPFDLSADSPDDTSWFFPQPLAVSQRFRSGITFSADADLNPEMLCSFKRGDNHLQVYNAQRLLNRYIRGHFGPEWLQTNGYPWPFLAEDGLLSLDTEEALKNFQLQMTMPQTGCLCPKTRALLPPLLRFRGSLLRQRLKLRYPTYTPPRYSGGSAGSSGSGSSSPQPNKPGNKSDNPVKTTGNNPAPTGTAADDDDDRPWHLIITPQWGFGASGPVWTSKSGTNTYVKPDTLEVDQKTEVDFSVPTSLALGQGKLKLTIGGEYDSPVDKDHKGKSTIVGNFQLQADNLLKNDYVSFSPYLKYSPQWKGDGSSSHQLKAGAEVDFDLQKILKLPDSLKGLKASVDVNSGVQLPGGGNDPSTTAKAIVPLEGNLNISWDLPWDKPPQKKSDN